MIVTCDEGSWDEAMQLDDALGEDAAAWVAERIAIEMLAGEEDDVRRFTCIADRLQHIRRAREERWN